MSISAAQPRQDVQIRLPDGRAFNGPAGQPIEAYLRVARPHMPGRIVAALVNGRLRELSYLLNDDARITPVTTADSDGARIYRRSLSFLVIVAAQALWPEIDIVIQHSMPFGGYYCERISPDGTLQRPTAEELDQLFDEMQALVEADLPITQIQVPLPQALEAFRQSGDIDKADLFARRRKGYLTLYELNGVRDYFHGYMVASTGYLDQFKIHPYADGFIFQFPRRHEPDRLQPFEDEPRLATVFREYSDWLRLIDVPGVAALNRGIENRRIQEIVLVAEALHEQQLTHIAGEIAARRPSLRVVLISGPTSAGKTTFSKRLAVQLLARGIHPLAIPMDNYFVNRDQTPRDERGDYDFEALEAVDVPLFRSHLQQLLSGEIIRQPYYNFHTGRREWGEELVVTSDRVIIIEGIHGLNPALVEGLPAESLYRIFISAFTQLNIDRHSRVPTTDTRKLRRIVRDAAHRGYSAADTLRRWPSVRRGEKRYIFPYQNNADVFFNSALVYELAALKPLAQPLLLQVEPDTPERVEANRLLAFLQWFDPLDATTDRVIPSNSILREFIGGSTLEGFEPWRR